MTFDIYKLIDEIRPRPAMYLGEHSVSLLRVFLGGYMRAAYEAQIPFAEENPPFGAFHDWVAMKLGYYEGTSGWAKMLLESCSGDEAKALEHFFIYLDEFKQRQAKIILWARLPLPNTIKIWKYTLEGDVITDILPPPLVQIVKYTDDKGVFIRYLDDNGELVDREDYCQDLSVAFMRTNQLLKEDEWQRSET